MASFVVQNSVAFVTGTNKKNGIGRAIVEALVSNGASKVYATARHVSELDDLVAQNNGKVVAVELDVTDLEAVEKLAELYPDVTLVVNNAGYFGGTTSLGDIDKIKTEISINYLAPLAIVKSFSNVFAKALSSEADVKPTALVNINSIVSLVNYPAGGTYSASKAASHSLTQAQRRDLKNTLVIGVYPGPIDTAMADGMDSEKTPPSAVASAIIDALLNGTEDVFPDPIAAYVHEGWKKDAKAMERQMAE
jgi:NAD(P)-dependent dehydrogenase (short-subunit alcohol dehydrogenase family)